ncbi:MAG: ABC transporter permease subunit [Bacteroidota bacterium]
MKIFLLILGTSRELAAKATLYVLAGISTLVLLFAGLALSSATSDEGTTLLLFGNPVSPPATAGAFGDLVAKMETGFAAGLFAGVVLFGMFGTAGVIPDALDRGTVDLYLSKPISRWELLAGKYLGSVTAVFANILYFIGGLWLIIGLKVGAWNPALLATAFLMTFAFACLYAIVVLFGVLTRNMAIAIIAGFLYIFLVGEALQNREFGLYRISTNEVYRAIVDGSYYLFPQISAMQSNAMKFLSGVDMDWRPFAQSFLSSGAILGLAAWTLRQKDF